VWALDFQFGTTQDWWTVYALGVDPREAGLAGEAGRGDGAAWHDR